MTAAASDRIDDVDLRIFVRETRRGDRTVLGFELQLAGEPREELSSLELKVEPHEYFVDFWEQFNRLAQGGGNGQRLDWLFDKSASLTRQIVPQDLQERFWQLKDDVETVQIHSDAIWIPWELFQLRHRKANGTWEHGQLLSEAFALTRWQGPLETARRQFTLGKIGYLIAAVDELPSMVEETDDLKRLWAGAESVVTEIPGQLAAVRQRLTSEELEGLHVVGHGRLERQLSGSVALTLGRTIEDLTPEILDGPVGNVGKSGPLVFFNTCHSARSGQALSDVNSWATQFIKAGAGAFIGAAWVTDDRAARLFATSFYDAFLRGMPIGRATREARVKVKAHFPGDPTWLAYVVYGHPAAIYQKKSSGEGDRERVTGRRSDRAARLAITPKLGRRVGRGELDGALKAACSRAEKALRVDVSQYRSTDGGPWILGARNLDEAHDFAVELLESLPREGGDAGKEDLHLCISLGGKTRPAGEPDPEQMSQIGPSGQILIDVESWSQLSLDRRERYGAEEILRLPGGHRAIRLRRSRVTRPAPDEADLVNLREGHGLDPQEPPYIGPDFFGDATRGFFGRDREIRTLCAKIQSNDYTLVYAASGAGKSSLVHAGIPGCLDGGKTECILVRYYLPSDAVANRDPEVFFTCLRDKLRELLRRERKGDEDGPTGGTGILDLLAKLSWQEGRERVLIIDQFENSLLKDDAIRYMDVVAAREKLFHALRLAIKRFKLKVALVFREEYLAKIKDLCETLSAAGLNGSEFYLKSLGNLAALEVIRNHARMVGVDYEDGLAEKIVRELSRNNAIAPVQLQVVCRMIWENLSGKEGDKIITSKDVASAAGDHSPEGSKENLGANLQRFIKSSVQQFYYRKLEKIATEDRDGLRVDVDLLHIGCMEFVSSSSHHDALQREGNRIGRLPESIVNRLENEYLIRRVEVEGKSYYELIHDTVAEAISAGGQQFQIAEWQAKRFTKDPNKLLYALKSLEFLVKRYKSEKRAARSEHEAGFRKGLFVEHDEMLKSIESFQKRPGLFEDESELVLRCVLASGREIEYLVDWARNIAAEYPDVFNRVLLEAIHIDADELETAMDGGEDGEQDEQQQEKAARIRRNAVLMAGAILEGISSERLSQAEEDIQESILACALEDEASLVWQAAVASLARIDSESFHVDLIQNLASSTGARLDRIYEIFVLLSEIAYSERATLVPAGLWPRLDLAAKARTLLSLWKGRLRDNLQLLLTAIALTLFSTPIGTALLRGPMAAYGLTQTQYEKNFFQGVFHAIAAGGGWAITITTALLLYWILFEKEGKPDPRLGRRLVSGLVGGCGGFAGGMLATSFAVLVFGTDSLTLSGWLNLNKKGFYEVFVNTRFGWIYPIVGTCVGIALGLLLSSLATSRRWATFSAAQMSEGSLKGELSRVRRIATTIVSMILRNRHCWTILLLPLVGAVLSWWLLSHGDGIEIKDYEWLLDPRSIEEKDYPQLMLVKSLCDAISFFTGAIGLAIGVLYSFIVDTTGVSWENRRRRHDATWS